jgi:hypothetical protein
LKDIPDLLIPISLFNHGFSYLLSITPSFNLSVIELIASVVNIICLSFTTLAIWTKSFFLYIKKHLLCQKNDKERTRLQDEFNEIQANDNKFDITNHLAKPEDLPSLGEIEMYDYEADILVSHEQSIDVLESLVDLF